MAPQGRATQQSRDTRKTNYRTITESQNGSIYNQQQINNNRTTALERTAA